MAAMSPHPLHTAPPCKGHFLQSSFFCKRRPQLSWWCHSPSLPSSCASSSTSPAAPLFELANRCIRQSEAEQEALSYGGTKKVESEKASMLSMAHSLWFGLLQWTLTLETRRSFIAGSLQQLSNSLFECCPSPPQLGTIKKRDTFGRRVTLVIPFLVAATSTCCNSSASVSDAEETRNAGRSFLQNFGIGDADIYYPRVFEGSWICNSTLVAVDTPQGDDKADSKSVEFSRKQLGYTVTYKARFIPFEKYIIGDRLFTTLSLVESTVGSNVVDHGIWTPQQPDRLTLVLRGGLKVQNIVTKRSASLPGPGQFDTSEYSQQIFDNNRLEGGPPTIKASQNRTRYRWDATNEEVSYIEAFQRVSMFPVIQEGLSNMDIMNLDKPVAVYKYIVRFTRESS